MDHVDDDDHDDYDDDDHDDYDDDDHDDNDDDDNNDDVPREPREPNMFFCLLSVW